jgi:hypothetical protein
MYFLNTNSTIRNSDIYQTLRIILMHFRWDRQFQKVVIGPTRNHVNIASPGSRQQLLGLIMFIRFGKILLVLVVLVALSIGVELLLTMPNDSS